MLIRAWFDVEVGIYWAWETRFSAVLRKTLSFYGELSFLALEASSRKTTSRYQWSWFSIDQCFLIESANVSRTVSEVIKYLVNSRISPFSAIYSWWLLPNASISAKSSPPQMIVHKPMISSLCRIFPYLVLLGSWIFLISSFSSSIFISLFYYFFQKK